MEAIYICNGLGSQSDYLFIPIIPYIIIRTGNGSSPCNLKITILYFKAFFEYFTHYVNQGIVWSSNWLPKKVNMY